MAILILVWGSSSPAIPMRARGRLAQGYGTSGFFAYTNTSQNQKSESERGHDDSKIRIWRIRGKKAAFFFRPLILFAECIRIQSNAGLIIPQILVSDIIPKDVHWSAASIDLSCSESCRLCLDRSRFIGPTLAWDSPVVRDAGDLSLLPSGLI